MSDSSREAFEQWYVDKWYLWRLKQGYNAVSKQEMLQNIILMRSEDKYEDGKDYLNHAWEGWQAAKQSMQGEAVAAWEYERATEVSEGLPLGDRYEGFERKLSFNKPKDHPQFRNASPLFRAPQPDRTAQLEKELIRYKQHYANAVKGRMDFRNSFRAERARNAQLEADKARLVHEIEQLNRKVESAYKQGRFDADKDNDAKIRGCLV